MSYNESTSICSMSGVPHFLDISGAEPTAYWKVAHPDGFNLTHGNLNAIDCFSLHHYSLLSKLLHHVFGRPLITVA